MSTLIMKTFGSQASTRRALVGGRRMMVGGPQVTFGDDLETALGQLTKSLFDEHGRRIPTGLSANVCDPNQNFRFNRPGDNCHRHLSRLDRLGLGSGNLEQRFKAETDRLLADLGRDPRLANLKNSVCLPVVLPKLAADDPGEELESLAATLSASYQEAFPGRVFTNRLKGALAGQTRVVSESRHDQLTRARSHGHVVALHFPGSLHGFSVKAARQQLAETPAGFALSGIDTLIAGIMYPEVLFSDANTLGLDLAALSWQSGLYSFSLKANDSLLVFHRTDVLSRGYDCFSGGLLFWNCRN